MTGILCSAPRSAGARRYVQGVEPLERARELIASWDESLRRELPADADIFDAHTHLGTDIDGMVGRPEELEGLMDRYGVSRCFVFCLDEPDRHPGFRAGNDRTLAFAARSDGRLIPFVRLALDEGPIEEATPLPRPGRARDQAPSAGAALRPRRRAARTGVRARGRAAGADPDPRRPRPAADRGRPEPARRRAIPERS